MVGRRRLTDREHWQAVGQLDVGRRQIDVAANFGVSQSVVSRLYQRYQQRGEVAERRGRGRTRATSAADDRYLLVQSLRERTLSAPKLRQRLRHVRGVNVSVQTIRNRLNSHGLSARRPVKGTPLTPRHRRVRQQWSRAHLRWTQQQWSTVLFTDKSVFSLSRVDGRTRVWRRKNERYANCNIVERDPYGGGALMVWAGISNNLKTDLVVINGTLTGQRYIDQVINPYVVPFFRGNRANFTLMDDNARPHRAIIVRNRLQQAGIQTMDWPSRSPDLNPIEHAWDELGRRLNNRAHRPVTLAQLGQALIEEWNQIPQYVIRRLVTSMRRRCLAVLDSRGGHTRY